MIAERKAETAIGCQVSAGASEYSVPKVCT